MKYITHINYLFGFDKCIHPSNPNSYRYGTFPSLQKPPFPQFLKVTIFRTQKLIILCSQYFEVKQRYRGQLIRQIKINLLWLREVINIESELRSTKTIAPVVRARMIYLLKHYFFSACEVQPLVSKYIKELFLLDHGLQIFSARFEDLEPQR